MFPNTTKILNCKLFYSEFFSKWEIYNYITKKKKKPLIINGNLHNGGAGEI